MADTDRSRRALAARTLRAGIVFLAVFLVGVTGYTWLGDGRWSATDAAYMVVITVSTVGFNETLPGMREVPGARFFTLVLILVGTGAMLYLTSAVTAFIVEADLRGYLRRRAMEREIAELKDHFILCGLGGSGSHIARAVHSQGHRLVVIEHQAEKLHRIQEDLGFQPLYIAGDATEENVLLEAGIERAAGLVAALTHDRDNLFLVFTARSMVPELRLVAKVIDPVNDPKIRRAGADEVVSPTSLGGIQMAAALLQPNLSKFMETLGHASDDPHVIEEIHLPEHSCAAGKQLGGLKIRSFRNALVLAIRTIDGPYRHNPGPDAVLQAGDALVVLVAVEVRDALRTHLVASH